MKIVKYLLISLTALCLSFLTISLVNPEIEFENEIYVDSEAPHVFAVFLDQNSMKEWFPQLVHIRHLEGLPFAPGSKELFIIERNGEQMQVKMEMEEFNAYDKMLLNLDNRRFRGKMLIRFHEDEKGTLVTVSNTIEPKNFLHRGVLAFMEGSIKSSFDELFSEFKRVAEA